MLKKSLCLAACLFSILSGVAGAQDRYQNRPPVIVSPDLTAPWVMQLTGERVVYRQQVPKTTRKRLERRELSRRPANAAVQPASIARRQKPAKSQIDPQFLPQMIAYETKEKPGTIVIDTNNRFLYLVTGNGEARCATASASASRASNGPESTGSRARPSGPTGRPRRK